MVTTDVVQGAFQAIVESHITHPHFYSVWSPIKSEKAETLFPACFWRGTDTTMTALDSGALRDGFIIDCMFIDQTAVDRTPEERDQCYARMNAIARQCWARFHQLYINATGTFQGVTMDFDETQSSDARFSRVWDIGTMQMTGCLLRVTIVSGAPTVCEDIYFDAS